MCDGNQSAHVLHHHLQLQSKKKEGFQSQQPQTYKEWILSHIYIYKHRERETHTELLITHQNNTVIIGNIKSKRDAGTLAYEPVHENMYILGCIHVSLGSYHSLSLTKGKVCVSESSLCNANSTQKGKKGVKREVWLKRRVIYIKMLVFIHPLIIHTFIPILMV